MTLPEYTPELARELRGELTHQAMADAMGLNSRSGWQRIEAGRRPSDQTWLLALIVSGRHPTYGPLSRVNPQA
ncbi:MAG: hypothetical protein RIQ53_2676 [Pseudomonadota bacterium]|jgi:hypothetical protein